MLEKEKGLHDFTTTRDTYEACYKPDKDINLDNITSLSHMRIEYFES